MSISDHATGPPTPPTYAIADSGCTAHFFTPTTPVCNTRPADPPVSIHTPSGAILTSTHEADLDVPGLPDAARHGHIVPQLATQPLLSIGQFCDAGCNVEFTKDAVTISHHNNVLLQGHRTPASKLWEINLQAPIHAQANAAIGTASPADLVAFAHAAMFSPALSTIESALRLGHLPEFAGLTLDTLRQYPPHSDATIKGHLDQTRMHLRSTQTPPQPVDPVPPLEDDTFPLALDEGARTHHCYAGIIEPTGQTYQDATGRFGTQSSSGNNYVLVVYDYDSNGILAIPFPNRRAESILAAYKTAHSRLCAAGCKPQLQRLDNEASPALQDYLTAEAVDYQLVPPHVHRRNAAERAIRTFKNHFIAGLCSTDPKFPLHLWDRLIPQAELTLNLLRGSRLNPRLSAWAQLHGPFDFNRTPIAPPGIRVIIHEKPSVRRSWAPHGVDGWYLGPALNSYRCYTVWASDTQAQRISDTVVWCPSKTPMPTSSSLDYIRAGIADITHALLHPSPNSPLAPLSDSQVKALQLLMLILHGTTNPNQPSTAPASLLRVVTPDSIKSGLTKTSPTTPPTPLPMQDPEPDPDPDDATVKTDNRTKSPQKPPSPPATVSTTRRTRRRRRSARLAALHATTTPPSDPIIYAALHGNAFNPDTGELAEYKELSTSSDGPLWQQANATEIHRLAQGTDSIPGTNTMFFIPVTALPQGCRATYLRIVCAHRPEKANPFRVRWTVGGDRVTYTGDVSTKTADIITAKLLFNSVVSTPGARCMMGDLKDFYLGTPMQPKDYAYMRIPVNVIPRDIMDHYQLHNLVHNGHVYVEIRRGMYGLPQAGKIANDQLQQFLLPHGYQPCAFTPGLWRHVTRDIRFTLVVDDFAVRYTNDVDANHLLAALKQHYQVTEDWDAKRYCGLSLQWDYTNRTVDLSMPGYIERALLRFRHPRPKRPEHAPHAWQRPAYGAKVQYAPDPDHTTALNAADCKRVQEVIGVLLYYARAVDPTMLVALGTLATQQAQGTQATMEALTQLLNYCATHPDATIRYHASDMVLWTHSDASYLTAPNGRSRAAGYSFLSTRPQSPPSATDPAPPDNGPIHVLCQIMRQVVSSAAEAELGALFLNAQTNCPIRVALDELGHPQPATPLQTDNNTASGILNDTVKQKRSKAIDMRFYWLRDRSDQGQFHIFWKPGASNRADYFSKHHPASHHQAVRGTYLACPPSAATCYTCLPSNDPMISPGEGVLIAPARRSCAYHIGSHPRLAACHLGQADLHNANMCISFDPTMCISHCVRDHDGTPTMCIRHCLRDHGRTPFSDIDVNSEPLTPSLFPLASE